jgi:hypothetical protein
LLCFWQKLGLGPATGLKLSAYQQGVATCYDVNVSADGSFFIGECVADGRASEILQLSVRSARNKVDCVVPKLNGTPLDLGIFLLDPVDGNFVHWPKPLEFRVYGKILFGHESIAVSDC